MMRNLISQIGDYAYHAHGYNLVAILADNKSQNGCSTNAEIYEAPGATNYFRSLVKSRNTNLFIDKLKSYIPVSTSSTCKASPSSDDTGTQGEKDEKPRRNEPASVMSNSRRDDGGHRISPMKRSKTYRRDVRKAIAEAAALAGLELNPDNLPWIRLPKMIAQAGLYIDNYPTGVTSPFGGPKRNNSSGDLYNSEHRAIIYALTVEKRYPMQFVKADNKRDLLDSKKPVIIYASPPANSPQERSQQYYLDGSYDYKGHRRSSPLGDSQRSKARWGPSIGDTKSAGGNGSHMGSVRSPGSGTLGSTSTPMECNQRQPSVRTETDTVLHHESNSFEKRGRFESPKYFTPRKRRHIDQEQREMNDHIGLWGPFSQELDDMSY
ncbi:hypothetical protein AX15_003507 [Amanita polypyramis BW_CC]|nr:hypothetical protein AX15_003507 [Amanita polypyramis BW_CC]